MSTCRRRVDATTPTLKQAGGLLNNFIHEAAVLITFFFLFPAPQKGSSDPSCYLWTITGSLQVPFHDSPGQSLYWTSLCLSSDCFHHDCPDGALMNRTRMITRLQLASAPFIPPMWLLMIFRAVHYMLPAFPRMSCKSRGKLPFVLLRRTQALCKLNRSSCYITQMILGPSENVYWSTVIDQQL